jgi:hypothetical protein
MKGMEKHQSVRRSIVAMDDNEVIYFKGKRQKLKKERKSEDEEELRRLEK